MNLDPLSPTESAKKWVEYLGDVDEVLRMAKRDFDAGEYQWVAEITAVIIYAQPDNVAARLLCADALEQLGYQSESGTWRNAYLTAALELRYGNAALNAESSTSDGDMQMQMTAPMLFDYMGILLDKQALAEYDFTINVILSDGMGQHGLRVKNGVILVYENTLFNSADITITCPKNALFMIVKADLDSAYQVMQVTGDTELFELFVNSMNQLGSSMSPTFNIVEP